MIPAFVDDAGAVTVAFKAEVVAGASTPAAPTPADGLFPRAARGEYDAVLAMYHDQGLVALKLLHFDDGVNVTLGLLYQHAAPEIARLERDGMLNDERKQGALKRSLDDLIAEKLLAADEKASNIEVTDQESDLAIEDVRKQNNVDATAFERALVSQGTSMTAYREKMKRDLGSMKLIGMKVRSKIKVADEDVKAE